MVPDSPRRRLYPSQPPTYSGFVTSYWGSVQQTEAVLEVQNLLQGLAPGEGDLLEALHRIQHQYGYVPPDAIPAVCRQLRLPPARVYGALTYYSEFRQTPRPDTTISWCSGPTCYLKGGAKIRIVLEKALGCALGQSTPDNRFGLHLGQCNGTCENAPQVWVDSKVVGPLTTAGTVDLVNSLRAREAPDSSQIATDQGSQS